MNISRIKETCLYVTDLQKTKTFYTEKIGLPLISFVEGRHVFFRAGESVLLCFLAQATMQASELPSHGALGQIHFAFEVPQNEYEMCLQKIMNLGIPILHQQRWKNGLRSFYFNDPDNHLLEVIEEGLWERF